MAPIVTMVGPKTPHGKEAIPLDVMQNIKVFVRCRPLKDNEKKNVIDVFPDRKEVRINESKNSNERYNSKTFTFDNAFASDTNQIQIYRSVVEPLIEQVVMGYNCTVFAYGQTGTGKTYTMEGERSVGDSVCSWEDDPTAGIIPRALHQLFESLLAENTEHTVRVSFLELYNEELYDLLSPIDDTTKLKIFEDSTRKGSVIVGGLEEITVHSKAEIYEILKRGSAKRQTAATLLNACSSRSHTIFSVTVHIKESAIDGEDLVKIGKLNLVDLAGSENIGRSGAIEKRAREAGNINQSLLTLGRVITSLVDRTPHIPYRESKLTRLLQESLGGRTKTSIIATISPNIADADDTLSTLEYAQRAKKITNKPEINQKMSKKTLLKEYTAEIERLRRDLAACREKNGIYVDQDNFNQMEQQIKDQIQDIEEKTSQIQALTEEMLRIQDLFEETKEELELTNKNLNTTSKKLTETAKDLYETRTDRDEQKYLVEIHVNSEKELSGQAKQLLSVAEVTTSDIERLHQKVNRQKSVETNNLSKTNEFQAKFLEDMRHLQDLVSITTTSCNDGLEEMQDSIKRRIKSIEEVVTEIGNTLQSFNDTINGIKSQFSSIFIKDRVVLEQSLILKDDTTKIDTNLVELFQVFMSSVNETQTTIHSNIEKLNQTVAQQRKDVEDVVIKQNSHNERVAKMINNSFDSIKKELKTIFEIQNEEMTSLAQQIKASNEANTESLKTFNSDMDLLETMITNIRAKQNNAFVVSGNEYKQRLDTIQEKIISRNHTLNEFGSKLEALAFEIRSEQKVGLKHIERIDSLNSETTQHLMNDLNEINTNNTNLSNNTKELIDSQKQLLSQQIYDNKNLIEDSIKLSDKQMTAKQTTLKSFEKCLSEGFGKQIDFVTQIVDNIDQIKDCVADKTSEVIRMSQTMEKSQIREIDNRSKSFENFVKNDLIKDIPTGSTPQKTTYSFPRDLVETSPHQRILERFRLINACNTPLPESEEKEDSEVLSSSDSTTSLHSFSSNDENMKPLTDTQKTRNKTVITSKIKSKTSPESDQSSAEKSNSFKRTATPRTLATKQNN